MDLQSLLDVFPNITPVEEDLITRAYRKAEYHHRDQFRKNGDPYFSHCVAVAQILLDIRVIDAEAIAAALMHDLIEDTSVTYDELALDLITASFVRNSLRGHTNG